MQLIAVAVGMPEAATMLCILHTIILLSLSPKKDKYQMRESWFCFFTGRDSRSASAILVHSFRDGVTIQCFRITWYTVLRLSKTVRNDIG